MLQCRCCCGPHRCRADVPGLQHWHSSPPQQGTPKLIRTSDCDFVFEWETPIVCPDEVRADGCSLTDEQLLYSFNLSSLSKEIFKVTHARLGHRERAGGVTLLADSIRGLWGEGPHCLLWARAACLDHQAQCAPVSS